jgi:hypothetical protein
MVVYIMVMKNITLAFVFMIFLVYQVSGLQFVAQDNFLADNYTIQKSYYTLYQSNILTKDKLNNNNPFQAQVTYSANIDSWNKVNLNNNVIYCNFSVRYFKSNSSNKYLFSDILYNDSGVKKYFIVLYPDDAVYNYMNCYFSSNRPNRADIPATMEIKTPTWECKACQYYEWSKIAPTLYKSSSFLSSKNETLGFITSFFIMIYGDIVVLFWIFMIYLLLFSLSLIFLGIYWIVLYLQRLTK